MKRRLIAILKPTPERTCKAFLTSDGVEVEEDGKIIENVPVAIEQGLDYLKISFPVYDLEDVKC